MRVSIRQIASGFFMIMVGAAPMTALANDIDFSKRAINKPFKDLPGVMLPDDELSSKNACTSTVEARVDANSRRRQVIRVYRCGQGDLSFESDQPPLEADWRRYKKNRP